AFRRIPDGGPGASNRAGNRDLLLRGSIMRIAMWPLAKIKLYPHNPRKNDHAVPAVAASIKEFGFRQPIVVDEAGVIIVGSTRLKAAQKLGLKKAPVHVAKGLSPAQVKAYRLADNKTAELADWDDCVLVQELAELQKLDFDLDVLGFSGEELQELFAAQANEGLTDPDDVPAAP